MKVRRLLAMALGTMLATASMTVVAQSVAPMAADAATPSCGYATPGTGTYASTICWVNFADFNTATAMTAAGQPMTVQLPGGYTATFTAKARPWTDPTTGTTYTDVSSCITPYALPYQGAQWPLGGPAYKGIPGRPGLLNGAGVTSGSTYPANCWGAGKGANLILDNIQVTDAGGVAVTSFGVVSTEAEASTIGEGIVWTSDVPINRLDQINPTAAGCTGTRVTGLGTTTVRCTGNTSGTGGWGTSLVYAVSPTTFNTASVNPGRILGTAYGFVTSSIRLNAVVHSGPGTFTVTAGAHGGGTLATGATVGGSGTTGQVTVLTGGAFDLTLAAGAGTTLSDYLQSWSCTRNGTADPTLIPTSATVTATPAIGDAIVCTVTLDLAHPDISVVKSATPNDAASYVLGQGIVYSFAVTNTGNVPLTDVQAGDIAFTGDPAAAPVPVCPSTSAPSPPLAPGAQIICTAPPYTLTQDDIDAGQLDNTAIAVANSAYGPVQSLPSSVTIPGNPAPSIALAKTVTPTTGNAAGDSVTYSFRVTNTGNVSVHGVDIDDPHPGLSTPTCPSTTLLPGATTTCTATYSLTQADVDAGRVDNTATATALSPANTAMASGPSSAVVIIPAAASIALVKLADRATVTGIDQPINYTFAITNTGNVTLHTLTVTETAFTGAGAMTAISCPAAPIAPAAIVVCTANYRTLAADVTAGSVTNTAVAAALPPTGAAVQSGPSSAVVVAAAPPVDPAGSSPGRIALTGGQDLRWVLLPAGLLIAMGIGLLLSHRYRMRLRQ